jgi:hypothetical protein
MRAGDLRAALIAPLLVYGVLQSLSAPLPVVPGVMIGLLVSAFPLLATLLGRYPRLAFLLWGVTGLLGAVLIGLHVPWGLAPGWSLSIGLLLGAPLVLLAGLIRWRHSLASSVGVTLTGLVLGALEAAVVRGLPSDGAHSLWAWQGALRNVFAIQSDTLQTTTVVATPAAPLGFLGDSLNDILALVAVMGLLCSMLLSSERLSGARLGEPERESPESAIGFAVSQLPPSAYTLSGVVPAVVTILALVLVVLSSAFNGPTLLGVTVAAWAALLALFGVGVGSRVPHPRPASRPAQSSALRASQLSAGRSGRGVTRVTRE